MLQDRCRDDYIIIYQQLGRFFRRWGAGRGRDPKAPRPSLYKLYRAPNPHPTVAHHRVVMGNLVSLTLSPSRSSTRTCRPQLAPCTGHPASPARWSGWSRPPGPSLSGLKDHGTRRLPHLEPKYKVNIPLTVTLTLRHGDVTGLAYKTAYIAGANAGFLKGGGGSNVYCVQKLDPMLKSLHRGPKGGGTRPHIPWTRYCIITVADLEGAVRGVTTPRWNPFFYFPFFHLPLNRPPSPHSQPPPPLSDNPPPRWRRARSAPE